MKRTALKKVGTQGRKNADANKKIAELWAYHGIDYCEADFPHECASFALTNAHRHKRHWYYAQPELLADFNQVARLCVTSHQYLEFKPEENEAFFNRLRT